MGVLKTALNWAQANETVLYLLVPVAFILAAGLTYGWEIARRAWESWVRRQLERLKIPPFAVVL